MKKYFLFIGCLFAIVTLFGPLRVLANGTTSTISVQGALYQKSPQDGGGADTQIFAEEKNALKSDWVEDSTFLVSLPPILESTRQGLREARQIPMQVGVGREIPDLNTVEKFKSSITWRSLSGGGQVASVVITSPNAKSMRMGIRITKLPQNTEFRYFQTGTRNTAGEIYLVRGKDILNTIELNKEADGSDPDANIYWSPSVDGDSIGVEIYLPQDSSPNDVQISIPFVSHIEISSQKLFISNPITNWPGPALGCQNDVNCFARWSNTKKSVAGMSYVKNGGSYVCTGTVLNDIDDRTWVPYFVTANHCISSQTVASTLETHWFHESVSCNSGSRTSSYRKVSGGAKLLSTVGWNSNSSLSGDATLMQLNGAPPNGAWFGGWTTMPPAKGSVVTGIHHPRADLKKISFATYGDNLACYPLTGTSYQCNPSSSGFFVRTNYYDGTTEGGSSGSAIFNNNYQVVGILKGGAGTCYDADARGTYTQFAKAYARGNWAKWLYTGPSGMPWLHLLLRNISNSHQ